MLTTIRCTTVWTTLTHVALKKEKNIAKTGNRRRRRVREDVKKRITATKKKKKKEGVGKGKCTPFPPTRWNPIEKRKRKEGALDIKADCLI